MTIDILSDWNPWWENKGLIKELEGKSRPHYKELLDSIKIREITIITGIRRAGKSTLMYQMIDSLLNKGIKPEQILFVNLEDKKLSDQSIEDIYNSYRQKINPDKKAFVFLDEINRREGWESWLRKMYDLKTKDKFIISGSSSYLLKKEYSTLLTGRNLTFEIYPLSFREFLYFKGIDPKSSAITTKTKNLILNRLSAYFELGGFPEIFFKPETYKKRVLQQYFDDILYKDIIDRYNLNSQKTKDLALFFMTNFTGIVSLRNVRNAIGLSYDTTKDYMSYFKEAFLFFSIDHFSYSVKEQKTLPSKIYCIDGGLRNAVSFKFSKDEGKMAENIVLVELKRREKDVYYWTGNGEVDFIVKGKDNSLSAINVCYSDKINDRETKGLMEFKEKFKNAKRLLVLTRDLEKAEGKIQFIPLWKWLLG